MSHIITLAIISAVYYFYNDSCRFIAIYDTWWHELSCLAFCIL